MNNEQLLQEFKDAKAILKGHFILSSGLHSDTYMQCARALMDPARSERICKALAEKLSTEIDVSKIDIVCAPAMGGLIVGYELARQLGKPSVFVERVEGKFELRRGFEIPEGANVLVVEDVVTTGKSSLETFDAIRALGGNIYAEAAIIDRTPGGDALKGVKLVTLGKIEVKTFESTNVPEELKNIPAVKPGSRFLKK
jgi:orotate phosphoribosyltransferase